ncbi:MAG: cohesin domain-containing protein [Pelobacteraceae bacterium]
MCNLRFITTLLLAVLVAAYDYGEAATIFNIAPSGAASYSITAIDLPDASGVDLTITYDTATLEAPKVTAGVLTSSAMVASNTDVPGLVRIAFITGGVIKGTGQLASISFVKKGNVPAPQPTLSSSAYTATLAPLAVQSTSGTPQPTNEAAGTGGTDNNAANPGSGGGSTSNSAGGMTYTPGTQQSGSTLGSVSLPQEPGGNNPYREEARKDERHDEAAYPNGAANPSATPEGNTAASQETSPPVAAPEAKTGGIRTTLKTSQSVLDRFRAFKNSRSLKQFSSLFDMSALHEAGIVQLPGIVVTDGKSLVTVTVDLVNEADTPSFSLKGANLKSIRRLSDKKWELVALPQKGKSDVRLSIILKGESLEIPLIAVPPIEQSAAAKLDALSATALDALLAKPLINNKPGYDLNSDGKQDYLDDYILVAHRLLKQQRSLNETVKKPDTTRK